MLYNPLRHPVHFELERPFQSKICSGEYNRISEDPLSIIDINY